MPRPLRLRYGTAVMCRNRRNVTASEGSGFRDPWSNFEGILFDFHRSAEELRAVELVRL